MTSPNAFESTNDEPGDTLTLAKGANWRWLQARVRQTDRSSLTHWLDAQLDQLGTDFEHLVTHNSLQRKSRR